MCEICDSATSELKDFLEKLQEKYPAKEIQGEAVSPGHHVAVAVIQAGSPYVQKAEEAMLESLRKKIESGEIQVDVAPMVDSNPRKPVVKDGPLSQPIFGGFNKVIES